jgi:hypothetical protein
MTAVLILMNVLILIFNVDTVENARTYQVLSSVNVKKVIVAIFVI